MDPVTHTMTGAALARAGLDRRTPLATAALVLGANAPDVDVVTLFAGDYASLAARRGWTHGPLAMLALPFFVAGAVLLWDRLVRRRRDPTRPPALPGAVLLLAAIGVLSHPALDWLNTYGIRLLMPFSGRWFYGDAAFIIDPWLWLALGGALFLTGPRSRSRTTAWLLLAALLSVPVLATSLVPGSARAIWVTGLLAVAAARWLGPARCAPRVARTMVTGAGVYIVLLVAASVAGTRIAAATAREAGITGIVDVLYAPRPVDPFRADIVIATSSDYRFGRFDWLRGPRARLDGATLPRGDWDAPAVRRALEAREVRDYLVWARYPFVRLERQGERTTVFIGDARYADGGVAGGLGGVRVVVDAGAER